MLLADLLSEYYAAKFNESWKCGWTVTPIRYQLNYVERNLITTSGNVSTH
jgi:hypothetical protein